MAEQRLELVGYQQLGLGGLYSFYFDVSIKSLKHVASLVKKGLMN